MTEHAADASVLLSEASFRIRLREETAQLQACLARLRTEWEAFAVHPGVPRLPLPFDGRWRRPWAPATSPAVDLSSVDVLSLDIFDTCLRRMSGEPGSVFRMLERLMEMAGRPCPGFAAARVAAENRLRAAFQESGLKEDVSLAEIYAGLGEALGWSETERLQALQQECRLERALLAPNPALLDLALAADRAGVTVIYITEMYLPAAFLAEVLRSCGFPVREKYLFASGELGLSKGSGRLYRHVAASFAGKRMVHVGDNPETDHHQPQRHGFLPLPVRRVSQKYQDSLSNVLFEMTLPDRAGSGFWEALGYGVVAPLAAAWMCQVLREARQRDVHQLLFLTRDGYFPEKVFRAMRIQAGFAPEAIRCFSSRRLLGLAAMEVITGEDWEFLLKPAPAFRIRDFFTRVAIPEAVYLPVCREAGMDPDQVVCHHRGFHDPVTKDRLYGLFLGMMDAFYATRDGLRDRVLAYLSSLQLEPGGCGILDIGWNGSSFGSLERLLGPGFLKAGFYLGIWRERQDSARHGRFAPFLITGPEAVEEERLIRGGVGLLEFLLGSPEDSVVDLRHQQGAWQPVYADPGVLGDYEKRAYAGMETGLLAFLEAFHDLGGPAADGDGRAFLQDQLGRLLYAPSTEEVLQLGSIAHVEGWGSGRRMRLLPKPGAATDPEARKLAYCYSAWKGAWSSPELA